MHLLVDPEEIRDKLKHLCKRLRTADGSENQPWHGAGIGVLLCGAPGTTREIARIVAEETERHFFALTAADLKTMQADTKCMAVQDVFESARAHGPVVLFIDELEVWTPLRGSPYADRVSHELVDQMLHQMDYYGTPNNRNVFVAAATQFPERIDEAVRTRFIYKMKIPPDSPLPIRSGFSS